MLLGHVEEVPHRFGTHNRSAARLFDFSDYFFVIVLIYTHSHTRRGKSKSEDLLFKAIPAKAGDEKFHEGP